MKRIFAPRRQEVGLLYAVQLNLQKKYICLIHSSCIR